MTIAAHPRSSRRPSPAELSDQLFVVDLCDGPFNKRPTDLGGGTIPQQQHNRNRSGSGKRTAFLKGLDGGHLLVIILLAVANLLCNVTFSCILPFFPPEAINGKELSTAQVGLLIGSFQLVLFLASPIVGKHMAAIRPSRAFSGGILLTGISTVLFALTDWLPPGGLFFAGVLLVRTAQAIGCAGFVTGAWAIVGRMFPGRISMITGILEISYGIGFTVGPPLGSALYELGGYWLPLVLLGSLLIMLMLCMSLPLFSYGPLSKDGTSSKQESDVPAPGIFQVLLIPDVFMAMSSLFLLCVTWTFYEADLANHLSTVCLLRLLLSFPLHILSLFHKQFKGWSPTMLVGVMLSILSCTYLVLAPISGYLFDKFFSSRTTSTRVLGAIGIVLTALLMGPSPLLLGVPKVLPVIGTSFLLLGITGAVLYVPVFKWCVDAAKRRGFDEKSPALCGIISGIFQSTCSLGAFLGVTIGGFAAQRVGMAWTATGIAALQILLTAFQLMYVLAMRIRLRQHSRQQQMAADSRASPY